ncbi:Nucleoside-triphosphatase THEP1 [Gossypium australe]|uniref:Nucleoside-triphosphatase THEP1 n=1 Tax=Gossypium australe TaxID=47621 RepID=A0A5B6WJJ6_9ROSI|nr:Nucleoside-triphosphatase THEP1 [Gossypium australe]
MREIWDQWDDEIRQLFYCNYGDFPYLLDIQVGNHLFRALAQYWNLAYSCFTFGKVDLRNLRDLIIAHPDVRKRVDVFILSIYGLVIFPKTLGHIDEVVSDLLDRLDKRVTSIPAILAKTFRSLNVCRRAGEGRFIGYAQLSLAWFHSHFWKVKKVSYRIFSKNYSPLKELVATPRRDDIT